MKNPFEIIKKKLANKIPSELLYKAPNKWEKVGDVVTLVLQKDIDNYKEIIGEVYAQVLRCKTVLKDTGGITGKLRKPNVEIIYGSKITETVHKENNVRFKLDPAKVMFSSGNMDERIRMANISNKDEVVVDLFAGIGYFSVPIAVHSRPGKIFACEKNKVAYDFLCENIVLNNVKDIVEPLHGDNREVAPKNVADRVIMGYISNTAKFLPVAFNCLKNSCGIIHFHDKFSDNKVAEEPMNIIQKKASDFNRDVEILSSRQVKSYAPGVSHYVFDIKVI